MKTSAGHQQGLGMIAAIVILVILSALAAALVSLSSTQQVNSAQDLMSSRAWQAAKAGNEWGLYQALNPAGTWYPGAAGDPCPAASGPGTETAGTTLDLTADTGFTVVVRAQCWRYNQGESAPGVTAVTRIYRITSVACNAATCPAADASAQGYVERTRVVLATN